MGWTGQPRAEVAVITKLRLRNFRAIAEAEIEVAPVTLLTGANNAGKSSVMYALLVLKNIVSNPNQPLDSFFNFQFLNLSGFKETVHLKEEESRRTEIEIHVSRHGLSRYGVALGKSQSSIFVSQLVPAAFHLQVDVTFPYALNQQTGTVVPEEHGLATVTWNGITGTTAWEQGADEVAAKAIAYALGAPVEDIKEVDFVPLKRGFVKPVFTPVPLQPQLTTEDEIATILANDPDLEGAVNSCLERIVNKSFRLRPVLGTSSFHLHTIDRDTGLVCNLVNDGFGTNQLVYLLTKALRKGQSTVCIEEPEIHVHPSALSKLVEVLIEVAKDTRRNFIISTHSEHFVVSLLNKVAAKSLTPQDVRVYYLRKERGQTLVEHQPVNDKGQIEGGLKGFYEAELQQIREFLAIETAQ